MSMLFLLTSVQTIKRQVQEKDWTLTPKINEHFPRDGTDEWKVRWWKGKGKSSTQLQLVKEKVTEWWDDGGFILQCNLNYITKCSASAFCRQGENSAAGWLGHFNLGMSFCTPGNSRQKLCSQSMSFSEKDSSCIIQLTKLYKQYFKKNPYFKYMPQCAPPNYNSNNNYNF